MLCWQDLRLKSSSRLCRRAFRPGYYRAPADGSRVNEVPAVTENHDTDSMLDVFTSVEAEETLISILSRDLSDVSIHSLLEETRQIAGEIKQRH